MKKIDVTPFVVLDYLTSRFNDEKAKFNNAKCDAVKAVHQRRAQMYLDALTIVGTVDQDFSLTFKGDLYETDN